MFNTYLMFFKWPDSIQSLFGYMFLPLVLVLYIMGVRKNNNFIYAIGLAIAFLFMSPAVTTPTYVLMDVIVLFLYYLFYNFYSYDLAKLKCSTIFSIKSIILVTLLNFWWIIPYFNLISIEIFQITKGLTSFNETTRINSSDTSFLNIFRLMGYWALHVQDNGVYYYPLLSKLYSLPLFLGVSFLVPVIVFGSIVINKVNREIKKIIIFFLILSLGALFFIKGVHEPFADINKWIFFNVPWFSMFRSQYEKLGTVLVLAYSVLFGFVISYLYSYFENRRKIVSAILFAIAAFIIFFVINIFPMWTGQNIQDKRGHLGSQRIIVPAAYGKVNDWLDYQLLDRKLLVFPLADGMLVHQWYTVNGNILLKLFNQPVVAKLPFNGKDFNLSVAITPFLNVQYIFTDASRIIDTLKVDYYKQIDKANQSALIKADEEVGQLKFYKINSANFLQHFYIPQKSIVSQQTVEDLSKIVSASDWKIRSAVFFSGQNKGKEGILEKIRAVGAAAAGGPTVKAKKTDVVLPTIEFKKIDPTKYRLIIHGAKSRFPLVFSESFHDGWKAYLTHFKKNVAQDEILNPPQSGARQVQNDNAYKILDGNADDQATADELNGFISKGLVSSLGDGKAKTIEHTKGEDTVEKIDYVEPYKIDFISKNFHGTIQNDNLPDGYFYETWFKKPIDDNNNHLMVNGYANSWLLDTDKICSQNPDCHKNPDGTYNFEVIVEFWPQRLFYIGLFVSGTTLLLCLSYLGFSFVRGRKKRHPELVSGSRKGSQMLK
ncbi:hypothetical protein HZA42_00510 [Candidatus Peregrinibacteria bacterium]|nr:hypothetical protein [Candidatus Peregrinibacteria bacterium]